MAQPTAGALKSLKELDLQRNQITDAGCATLASALRGGALPALKVLNLEGSTQGSCVKFNISRLTSKFMLINC